MSVISIHQGSMTVVLEGREITLDLSAALRVRLYNRPETRYYEVKDFEVRNVRTCGESYCLHLINQREGLFIPLTLKPSADGFRAIIHAGQIIELLAINRKVMEISLFPELMQSRVGDEGFFIMPCWTGALVRFKEHQPYINRDRIYMHQEEWEKLNLLNCFAMNRNGLGVLGIVHKGDFNCGVTTEINQNRENRIFPSFLLRKTDGNVIKQEDKEVIYSFSEKKSAEYPRMAMRYRDYLTQERGVSPLKERMTENPVLDYMVKAVQIKIFMGCKRPAAPDGSGEFLPMTTCAEAEKILEALQAAGIRKANIILVGWNLGGHDGAYPTRFPIEPGIGGIDALRKLIERAKEMGYQISPHDNVTDIYRSAPDYDPEYVARTEEGQPRVVGIWSGGQSFKACPVVYTERWGYDVLRVKELGFNGCYLYDAQSPILWTCHDPKHPADEEQFALCLAKMTQAPRVLYGAVGTEIASAFSLPFVDDVTHLHIPDVTHGHYDTWTFNAQKPEFKAMVERVVPFMAIALHGLLTYQFDWVRGYRSTGIRKGLLRELALGAKPSMEITYNGKAQDLYSDSIRDIAWGYETVIEKLGHLPAELITEFEEFGDEAVRVTYSNGQTISVNWGDAPAGGMGALSFSIQ